MTEREIDALDEYGLRLAPELHSLTVRALRPFDAGAIAREVVTGQARTGNPFGWAGVVLRAPRWLWFAVALVTAALLAAWAVVGQPSLPPTFAAGSVAYTRDYSLYVAAADGSNEVKVAQGDPDTNQINTFDFAPDRAALAFADDRGSGEELVVVAPDGRTLGSRVFDNSDAATWFSWGPDGRQLVVGLGPIRPELTIVGLDGKTVRTLQLPDGFTWGWLPDLGSWSPDGRWIDVFGCIQPCDIKFDPHILLVKADGSGWHWLENSPTGYGAREAWAPDSRLLLNTGIVSVADDGSAIWSSSIVGLGSIPKWSPDGSLWASANQFGIVVGSSEGVAHPVLIDRSPPAVPNESPAAIDDVGWSADGKDLLFVGWADASPVRSLYAIDPRGGTPRLVIEGVDESFEVAGAR